MKLTITRKTEQTEVVDVTFPVYLHVADSDDSGGSWEIWKRVTEDGRIQEISVHHYHRGHTAWEFESQQVHPPNLGPYVNEDYLKPSTEAAWRDALKQAHAFAAPFD